MRDEPVPRYDGGMDGITGRHAGPAPAAPALSAWRRPHRHPVPGQQPGRQRKPVARFFPCGGSAVRRRRHRARQGDGQDGDHRTFTHKSPVQNIESTKEIKGEKIMEKVRKFDDEISGKYFRYTTIAYIDFEKKQKNIEDFKILIRDDNQQV